MNAELQDRFESHTPLIIYPLGLGDSSGPRVIAEGFVYPEGVFFFDVGWNCPPGGYHSSHPDHFVEGEISGPFPDFEETVYWEIGRVATIHEIPEDGFIQQFTRLLTVALENQKIADWFRHHEYKNREYAKKLADSFVAEYRVEYKRNVNERS